MIFYADKGQQVGRLHFNTGWIVYSNSRMYYFYDVEFNVFISYKNALLVNYSLTNEKEIVNCESWNILDIHSVISMLLYSSPIPIGWRTQIMCNQWIIYKNTLCNRNPLLFKFNVICLFIVCFKFWHKKKIILNILWKSVECMCLK